MEEPYYVYILTRRDGKQYVGETMVRRFKYRMKEHFFSERFGSIFCVEVLAEVIGELEAKRLEAGFVREYDTFNNGLNKTTDGGGLNIGVNFTTKGFRFSEASRKKMSEKAKGRVPWNKGRAPSEETRQLWREQRRGRVFSRKITDEMITKMRLMLDVSELTSVRSNNGRVLHKERAFAKIIAPRSKELFGVSLTSVSINNALTGKTFNA